ncbi:MAG: VOC family protein [Patescibacteria group bacterium]
MQKITPHLWFDTQAKEAAEFYISIFPNSKINTVSQLRNTPSGDCDIVSFEIEGQPFMSISAGPYFKINPSVSFLLNFDPSVWPDAEERLNTLWAHLIDGGNALMPLQEYPHSKWYGWVQDKYGVSWQLMLTNPDGEKRPFVTPSIMYANTVAGKAEEAIDFYTSVFKDGKRGTTARYPAGMEPDKEGTLMYADFFIMNTWLAAMDSARSHEFIFNEGVSLMIPCDTQEEIDYYWQKLSAVPEAEQCGWLKDKFGLSWQVTSTALDTMMTQGTQEQIDRVTQAFLKMKKFDIATLEKAYNS